MPSIPVIDINKAVAQLRASLNKGAAEKGASVCANIDMAPNVYFLRRPSGIMELDVHTGGGLPAGGLTYIGGPDGIGKTVLVYKYMALNQKIWGPRSCVALAVSEAAPDHFFMRKCGMQIAIPEIMIEERVAMRKYDGRPAFTKEEIKAFRAPTVGNVILLRGATGEELLDAMLRFFDKGICDIIALDSISAVLPEADAGKDLDENQKRAAAAGLITKFFQHYLNGTTGYNGANKTTVIFTTQVRSNSKKAEAPAHIAKYLPDYVAQGAWAAKHGKLIDINLKPGEKEKEKHNVEGVNWQGVAETKVVRTQVGKTVRYEITKGKAGVHDGITGEYQFSYEHITEDQRMILLSAMQMGIAKEEDGLITIFHPHSNEPVPEVTKVTFDVAVAAMKADFELELRLRRMVLSSAGVECSYR